MTGTDCRPERPVLTVVPNDAKRRRDLVACQFESRSLLPLVVRDDSTVVGRLHSSSVACLCHPERSEGSYLVLALCQEPFVAALLRVSDRLERKKRPFGRLHPSSVACLCHPERSEGSYLVLALCQEPFVAALLRVSDRHGSLRCAGRLLLSSRAQRGILSCAGSLSRTLRRCAPQGKRSTRLASLRRSPAYVIPSAARDPILCWLSVKNPSSLRSSG